MSRNENLNKDLDAQHYDVFFSYSRKDTQIAMLIKSAIQSLGYTVFYDQDILEGDSNWRATIAKNIDNCSGLVFFRTQNSVSSKWCQREVNIADESDKTILPISFQHDQNALPSSPELKCALLSLQTSYISESPSIADLKNELQIALEKAIGAPKGKENSLLLTDFILSATENINSRCNSFFEHIGARKITADVGDYKIVLRWRFSIGDESADICIALNKYSKRPDCYGNCKKHDECRFYNQKDKTEYSVEAYLDFINRSRKSRLYDVLECLLGHAFPGRWCGSLGIKYFFRKPVLSGVTVNDTNDFNAMLLFLGDAVEFFDTILEKIKEYMFFAYDVCEIFREEHMVASILNGSIDDRTNNTAWTRNDSIRSKEKIHFYKNNAESIADAALGKYCSVAIQYPVALRIKLEKFATDSIIIQLYRFEKEKQVTQKLKFSLSEFKTKSSGKDRRDFVKKEVKDNIKAIFQKECETPFSTLPEYIHEGLNNFIKNNNSLYWEVAQDTSNEISATGFFRSKGNKDDAIRNFSSIRFAIRIKYHSGLKTVDLEQYITSDFLGANAETLSEITGYSLIKKTVQNPEQDCTTFFNKASSQLANVHENVYKIYRSLSKLDNILSKWKKGNAATVLLLDSTRSSYVDGYKANETCWEYYLSPGTRLCRRLHIKKNEKDYPVMFSIRFESSGARKASIGWCADHDFNYLSTREKELFWRYVLSQFPQEVRGRFGYRKNAIFFAGEENDEKEDNEKSPKFYPTIEDVESVVKDWTADRDGGSLMDQMFAKIEKAVRDFKIQTSTH